MERDCSRLGSVAAGNKDAIRKKNNLERMREEPNVDMDNTERAPDYNLDRLTLSQ